MATLSEDVGNIVKWLLRKAHYGFFKHLSANGYFSSSLAESLLRGDFIWQDTGPPGLRYGLERNLDAGLGDDDFSVGELFFEAGFEPGGGGWVAVDEEDFFWTCFYREVEEFFATGMAGEIEFVDLAVEGDFVGSV